ncbi:hypothetical protein Aoki45_40100 [Algoriphagus sp. oki45]|uniref:DUF6734 family protein n=1 Tax=Algoriphagus sp. oki45 TaxID=3067294 RepID=UPI0028000A0D|nr:hypothetical protein Aoki45_40100 [Algoriphagus sp. oki45]
MKIVQTFWIDEGKDPLKDSFGWCSAPYHLMSWALSCLQLHQFYEDLELITDRKGKELLIDQLQLPFKKVRVELDDLDLVPIPGLWVMKKIYSYTLHEEPFLNVDGDVYVYAPFPSELLSSQLIAQNIEQDFDYYKELVGLVGNTFPFVPKPIKEQIDKKKEIQASNAGILGGKNHAFFKDYFQMVEQFITVNQDQIKALNPMQIRDFNQLVEQYIFHCLSNDQGIEVNYLLDPVYDPSYMEVFGNFHHLPTKSSYIHTLGDYKKNGWVCDQLAHRLRLDYPDYYRRISDLFESDQKSHSEKTHAVSKKDPYDKISSYSKDYLAKSEKEQFYRTDRMLTAICEKEGIAWDRTKFTIQEFKDYLESISNITPWKRILNDVYEFEEEKLRLIRSLLQYKLEEEKAFSAIQLANEALKDPNWQEKAELKLAANCKTIISEWDWSQNSVLFTQIKMNSIEENLLPPPHFYQTLLLWDQHHTEIIEYLVGPIASYLLSVLSEDSFIQMTDLSEKVCSFFQLANKDQVMDLLDEEIRFLAYSGVIHLSGKDYLIQ